MFHITSRQRTNDRSQIPWHELFTEQQPAKRIVANGQTTAYERSRLAQSIHRSCMRSFGFSGEAEVTAKQVCHEVERWLQNKEEVTKADIKRHAAQALHHYNPRAAYAYLPSKDYAPKEDFYGFVRL